MSDSIKHECGIAMVRLLKPAQHYIKKYNTPFWGLHKLHLLMQKQHNRGQDGAGVAAIKFNTLPGEKYISRHRALGNNSIHEIFEKIYEPLKDITVDVYSDENWLYKSFEFNAELYLGHLRYGTFGLNDIHYCHPFIRQNNWKTKNLVLAGNFNMTNVEELFDILVNIGQHPREKSDTVTVLEKIGHFLDEENERLFKEYKQNNKTYLEISNLIAENIDITGILKNASADFDGGYAITGMIGHGDAFVLRDPNGIRPAYYYADEEVVVVASERPAIQTSLNVSYDNINEILPGHALIIKRSGKIEEKQILPSQPKTSCTFERIYFSRGTDKDIYTERKKLGELLTPNVLMAVNYDFENTVFSFIPNTAEVCFYGLLHGAEKYLQEMKLQKIPSLIDNPIELQKIIALTPRIEKLAVKDMKLRTFITSDNSRNDLVAHIYDITYGSIQKNKDTIVVIDDSIVRGTTLKNSIIKMLDRLNPKKIVVVSSAPQIRYPDCYGIDMAKLGDFIAFQAAVALLKERGQSKILQDVYKSCKEELTKPKDKIENKVKSIYESFTDFEISSKIAELIKDHDVNAEIEVIFQSVENLHKACLNHSGDWYFTGNYPTPGGNKVVNKSFVNYMEGRNERAY